MSYAVALNVCAARPRQSLQGRRFVASIPVYICSVWRAKRFALLIIGVTSDEKALARLPPEPAEATTFACAPIAVSIILILVAPRLAHLDRSIVGVW